MASPLCGHAEDLPRLSPGLSRHIVDDSETEAPALVFVGPSTSDQASSLATQLISSRFSAVCDGESSVCGDM